MTDTRIAHSLARLHDIMKTLRSPGGCPWDALQTTTSLRPYLLEETYELLEALDLGRPGLIRDELGDLLLQIVFHAEIFAEQDIFDLADVADAISDKLERRHPHVFGDAPTTDLDSLNRQWDRIKASENNGRQDPDSPFNGIPRQLPALARAAKYIERGRRNNLEGILHDSAAKDLKAAAQNCVARNVGENEVAAKEESFGEFLLAAVAWGQHRGLDAEQALRRILDRIGPHGRMKETVKSAGE